MRVPLARLTRQRLSREVSLENLEALPGTEIHGCGAQILWQRHPFAFGGEIQRGCTCHGFRIWGSVEKPAGLAQFPMPDKPFGPWLSLSHVA